MRGRAAAAARDLADPPGSLGAGRGDQSLHMAKLTLPPPAGAATVMREALHSSRSAADSAAADVSGKLNRSSGRSEPVSHASAAQAPQQADERLAGASSMLSSCTGLSCTLLHDISSKFGAARRERSSPDYEGCLHAPLDSCCHDALHASCGI